MVRESRVDRQVSHSQDVDVGDSIDLDRHCEAGSCQGFLLDLKIFLTQEVISCLSINPPL